jgi:hypothetical protein
MQDHTPSPNKRCNEPAPATLHLFDVQREFRLAQIEEHLERRADVVQLVRLHACARMSQKSSTQQRLSNSGSKRGYAGHSEVSSSNSQHHREQAAHSSITHKT